MFKLQYLYNPWDSVVNELNNYTVFLHLIQNGKWNGLMAALVGKKFDMVLTSLKINAERESVVDFTAPFLGKNFNFSLVIPGKITLSLSG